MKVDRASQLSALEGIAHGFFGRRGGVSDGPFTSLNVSLRNADDRAHALENRRRIAASFGADPEDLAAARQVHGIHVHRVERAWGSGEPVEADALMTTIPGIVLGVTTADCGPILLADPGVPVVAAVHAGWRGALDGIVEAVVAHMVTAGASTYTIVAAVGPCSARRSYEVGREFLDRFATSDPSFVRHFDVPADGDTAGTLHFDLSGFLEARLRAAGLGRVERIERDTYALADDFFSFRRTTHQGGGPFGLQLSAIVIEAAKTLQGNSPASA